MPHSADRLLGEIYAGWEFEDFQTTASRRAYRAFISRPAMPVPEAGYPILYMTDANLLFATLAEQAENRALAGEIATAMIVAIGYPGVSRIEAMAARMADFASAPAEGMPSGTDRLRRFLLDELMPAIERRYPVDRDRRSLFGYSLGGVFALDTLLREPAAFECVVAASPSIWVDEAALLERLAAFDGKLPATRLLITAGGCEQSTEQVAVPPGMSREQVVAMVSQARMIDKAKDFVQRYRPHAIGEGAASFLQIEGETHASVSAAAIGHALGFALGHEPGSA